MTIAFLHPKSTQGILTELCENKTNNPTVMSEIQNKINKPIENRETARMGGGQKAIDKQHERAKYTARERIQMLLDEGSFEEFDMFVTHRCYDFGMEKKHTFGDGVVTGYGTIEGRLVYVFAQGLHRHGGFAVTSMSDKICRGSWTWPCATAPPASASTTRAAPVSRRA